MIEVSYGADDQLWVIWGKYGYIRAVVDRVTNSGSIYVKRWNKRRSRYTTARRTIYRNGAYYVV